MSEKTNKISVLHKMNTNVNSKSCAQECTVPQNSSSNLRSKHGFSEAAYTQMESACRANNLNNCPHCENMAKNFLYLESLIRHNYSKKQPCNMCNSSLKYLQYVNRNIMQVFGQSDAIVKAAKDFAENAPLPIVPTKVPTTTQPNVAARIVAGAVKPTGAGATKTLGKSPKSSKSSKSLKTNNTNKSHQKLTGQLHRFSTKAKSKMAVKKIKSSLNKVVRSASQYHNLRARRNNKQSKIKTIGKGKGDIIPWRLLKQNMPKRKNKDASKKAN